ncbi:MAG: M43 family zinc metalloprotease [Saprospiraceae bacterium]
MRYFTRCCWLTGLSLLLTPFGSSGQKDTHSWDCASDLMLERAQQNPDWLKKHQQSEQAVYDFFSAKTKPLTGKRMMTVTLPVVVHIIHDNGPENITDAQVLNGIQQLNDAFANTAYYDQGTGTNTMIQFCLAQRTPDDQATTGITRDQNPLTDLTIESDDIAMKDLNRWTPTDYINIWLVREICSAGSGCGVAGYAYLPASHGNPEDGIVMEAEYLGASPGGTGVLAHEMGHYLGLYHTFQGGCANDDCLTDGDRVCDTPPDQSVLWTACDAVVNTCNTDAQSGFSSDQSDMILNFMDYTDFDCFNDFTPGQGDRMQWHIENVRSSLLDSRGCLSPCPNPITATFTASAASVNVGQTVNFTNGSANAASYTWTINGVPFSSTANASYTFTTAGTFVIALTANSGNPDLCRSERFERIIDVVCPVVAAFAVNTLNPALGEAVMVTNQSQNATQYEWFLEGIPQGAAFTGFTPSATGVYVIRLVAGNGFCEQSKLAYLSVQDSCANTSFQQTWGGPSDDRGSQTIALSDGNFLVAGTTVVSGETDIYLLKTEPNGATIWQRRFGLVGVEQVGALLALPDGGWMLMGNLTAGANNTHPFLARFSTDGTVLWQKRILTPAAVNIFTGAILTQDGNLLVSGAINNPSALSYAGYLAKMTLDGTVLWSNLYDGGNTDWISGLLELPNGDIAATGFTLSFGQNSFSIHDGMVIRLTSTGTLLWVNAYGSTDNEGFSSIFLTPDGNLMTMGATSGWNGPGGGQVIDDSWMVKLTQNGALLWSQVYRTNLDLDLSSRDVLQSSDGGYVIAANDLGNSGTSVNSFYFKTSPEGDLEWSRMYAATGENRLTSVDAAPDGYIFTGYVDNAGNDDLWLLRTDEAGLAGVCPELPHQVNVFPAQPVVESGVLNTLSAPALVDFIMPINDFELEEEALCSPVCLEDSDCEDTWIKTAGVNGIVEGGTNIIQSADGNFYLSGYRGDSTLLMKMTPDGLMLWTRTFKFTSGTEELVSQLIEDSEGNLVGCGLFTTSNQFNGFTFKYDPSSDQVMWAHQNPATPQTLYYAILEISPGGNYLAFNSYHNSPAPGSNDDANMVEINRNTGQYTGIKRAFSFGASEGVIEAQLRNGRIYTAGRYTYGNNFTGMRGGISCFDLSGNEVWSRMPFFSSSEQARNYATDFVFDGGNMVTIHYGDFSGDDAFTDQFGVSKSDLNGNLSWARLYTLDGFPEIFVKSIVTVPDGYVILATNVKIDQPASIFLIKIDKNGTVLWAQDYRDMFVLRGEKFLATANDYLYFIASYGTGDIALAKVALSDGLVNGDCEWPLELVVSVQDLPSVFAPIDLVDYPSPIIQTPRVTLTHARSLTLANLCLATCSPEICNNSLDDDGDGLFDCLDPDCDCSGCDGEQTRYWYFGDGGGLDFATDPPTVLNDGQTFSREASSVATDMMGNLLFYTDAASLFDRNHQLMPNGNNLHGHASTTQTLILPQPGSPWRFFVFTPNSFDNLASGNGLSYSIVDMKLNGSLGDVEPGQKNIALLPQNQFTEKITATRHCNGTDWWILVKERNNNNFRAYPLTATGLGAPVISSVGTPGTPAAQNVASCLKFSPNGKIVVNALFQTGGFDLFDFDNSTGLLSNAVTVTSPLMSGVYGIEFSADGNLLYLSNLLPPSHIWQFDPNAGDAAAILQSGVVLAEFPDQYRFGQLQRAQNGKIYVTNTFPLQFTNSLGIIHLPEVPGLGCLYQEQGINIAPGGANIGLPSFPQDFLPKRLFVAIEGPDSLCKAPATQTFSLDISDRCALDSVRWTLMGAGNILSQSDEGITVNFSQPGMATLIATAFSACAVGTDTLRVDIFQNNTPVLDLGPDFQVCDNGVHVLDAGPGFQQYRWNDGSTESKLTTFFPGAYWVDVWDICGNKQNDTIRIAVLPSTILDLGDDRTICSNAPLTYTLPANFASWNWSPATGLDCSDCNTVTINAGDTITYTVVASNGENCLSADTLTIFYASDTIFASLDTVVCSNETLLLFGQEFPADTVVQFYGVSAGGCDSVLTVTILGLDPAQTLVQETICPGDTLIINGATVTGDTTMQFLLVGENGCDSLVILEVELLESPVRSLTLVACPGSFAIYNGVQIPPGTTQVLYVPGMTGACDSIITVTVTPSSAPILQLPATDTLEAGNAIQLTPFVFGNGPFLWQWGPAPPPEWLSCYDCPDPVANPLATTLFSVTVTDVNGCEGMDSINLVVLPCKEPYVPNVFSPNGDGVNDWFYLQSSECPVHIRYLRIFDRWGELVFQRTDFSPNIPTLGWDGRFSGKMMTSNVFVWVAEIEFPGGAILLKKGDVTLLK